VLVIDFGVSEINPRRRLDGRRTSHGTHQVVAAKRFIGVVACATLDPANRQRGPDGDWGAAVSHAIVSAFASESKARLFLEHALWPDGPMCPYCDHASRARSDGAAPRERTYTCPCCRRTFSITSGTVFEHSDVPLHKWLQVIYLTDGGDMPVRAYHVARIVDVSNEAADSMLRSFDAVADGTSRQQRSLMLVAAALRTAMQFAQCLVVAAIYFALVGSCDAAILSSFLA
jgi:transposase-like protein